MHLRPGQFVLALAAVVLCAGCTLIDAGAPGRSPLTPAQQSSDSACCEIFTARCPSSDKRLNAKLWAEIDDQSLPADLRHRLAENGFRVGIVGPLLPEGLTTLLKISEHSLPDDDAGKVELANEPNVTKRLLPVRFGNPYELVASHVYDELPLLTKEDGQVSGRPYLKVQGVFTLQATAQPASRVALEILPQLQYGEPRVRSTVSEGMLRLETGREKKSFKELTIPATLAPGQMLVLTCRTDSAGSIGQKFFTELTDGQVVQKLMVIRLAQSAPDKLFSEQQHAEATEAATSE